MNEKHVEKIIAKTCARLETKLDLSMEERERAEFLEVENVILKREIEVLKGNLKKICGATSMNIRCIECDRFVASIDCQEVNQELLDCKNNHVPF